MTSGCWDTIWPSFWPLTYLPDFSFIVLVTKTPSKWAFAQLSTTFSFWDTIWPRFWPLTYFYFFQLIVLVTSNPSKWAITQLSTPFGCWDTIWPCFWPLTYLVLFLFNRIGDFKPVKMSYFTTFYDLRLLRYTFFNNSRSFEGQGQSQGHQWIYLFKKIVLFFWIFEIGLKLREWGELEKFWRFRAKTGSKNLNQNFLTKYN